MPACGTGGAGDEALIWRYQVGKRRLKEQFGLRVVEMGSHAELVARGGLYAGLWSRQTGGFLVDESVEA